MKTAIYIEDGTVQLVLTPESKFEKNAIAAFSDEEIKVQIHRGAFYECQGGWIRHRDQSTDDDSMILRVETVKGSKVKA